MRLDSLRSSGTWCVLLVLMVVAAGDVGRAAAPGDLDPTFSPVGYIKIDFFDADDRANAAVVQPDGKIVVVGPTVGAVSTFAVSRVNPDGSLDSTFGSGGRLLVPAFVTQAVATAVALQPDGKIVVAGYRVLATGDDFAVVRVNSNGTLDTSFDADGKQTIDFGATDRAGAVAIQPDGKIVVVGGRAGASSLVTDVAVARLDVNGALDPGFANTGARTYDFQGSETAAAVALDDEGRIVVAGSSNILFGTLGLVVRLTRAGKLDTTFDGDGFVFAAIETLTSVAVQIDGAIVAGGGPGFQLVRFTASGVPDTGFGTDGYQKVGSLTGTQTTGLVLLHNGKVVLGGTESGKPAIAVFNANGTPDTAIASDGRRAFALGGVKEARGLAVQPDGQLVLVGYGDTGSIVEPGDSDFAILRIGADPPLDLTFDKDGRQTTDFGETGGAYGATLQPDGKLIVVGYESVSGDTVIARYSDDGSLDGSFDGDGRATARFQFESYARAVARQPDGKLVVAGWSHNGFNGDFAVARFNADGTLDATFNHLDGAPPVVAANGRLLIDFNSAEDRATGIVIQPDGKIVIAGVSNDGFEDFAVARLLPDGTLDSSFGSGGRMRMDFPGASSSDAALGVALQPDGKLLLAGYTDSGTPDLNPAMARLTSTGAPDPTFGVNGQVVDDIASAGQLEKLALLSDGRFLVVGSCACTTNARMDLFVERYTTAGVRDTTFGVNGSSLLSWGSAADEFDLGLDLAVQANGKIVVAAISNVAPGVDAFDFGVARLLPDGALDSSFHNAGRLLVDMGGDERSRALAFDPATGTAVVVGTTTTNGVQRFAMARLIPDLTLGLTVTTPEPAPPPSTASAATVSFLAMEGTAGGVGGITHVTWSNSRGGGGTAIGTTAWHIPDVLLVHGSNEITIRAFDAQGQSTSTTRTITVDSLVYYLAEGATGPFFDYDLLLTNPTNTPAPISITFLKADGTTVVDERTLEPTSRTTIRVDDLPGLGNTAVSAVVTSTNAVPLVVERTMAWDANGYGAHAGSSVASPDTTWLFAEGSQGFFDTYVLLANANQVPADVTVTFLLESGAPVAKTVTVGPTSRFNVYAGSYPELVNKSFSMVVSSSVPIIAERAMYFGQPLFNGGHESAGVNAPSTTWFLAEGATGAFFDTYVLIGNPNATPATATVTFLTGTGQAITRTKTIPANARLTINIEAESPVLADAAVSTTVVANVPVIAERAMYWPGPASTWYEAHNSFGVTQLATKWGLAEGRSGGPQGHETYILLANPDETTAAQVQVTFERPDGTTVVKTYTVNPTSRFNIAVNAMVPELADQQYGAVVEVTNGIPIAVERAVYSNAFGVFWAAGTNATGVRVP
ncbi:MAG: hypothetical protein AB7I50_13385 [Vicinamibacterales bacterium]